MKPDLVKFTAVLRWASTLSSPCPVMKVSLAVSKTLAFSAVRSISRDPSRHQYYLWATPLINNGTSAPTVLPAVCLEVPGTRRWPIKFLALLEITNTLASQSSCLPFVQEGAGTGLCSGARDRLASEFMRESESLLRTSQIWDSRGSPCSFWIIFCPLFELNATLLLAHGGITRRWKSNGREFWDLRT